MPLDYMMPDEPVRGVFLAVVNTYPVTSMREYRDMIGQNNYVFLSNQMFLLRPVSIPPPQLPSK